MQEIFKGFADTSHTVNEEPKVPKKSSKVVGEYIDYEEVE